MKNQLWITLTDVRGSRQYGIARHILRRIALSIVLLLVAMIIYPLWLNHVNATWQARHAELLSQHRELSEQHKTLIASEQSLKQALDDKNQDYLLSKQQYELLVGELNYQDDYALLPSDRFTDVISEVGFRRLVLQLLPNGRPTSYDRVTSSFGSRQHPFLKEQYQHKGIDVHSSIGTPVYATADGVVTSLQNTKDGFGKLIKIGHAFGFQTYYGHLKTIGVDWYQVVKKGDIIGYSGNSGRSTGPHLHYEVRFGEKALDPADFILWNINNFETQQTKIEEIPWASLMASLQQLATARPQPLSPKIVTSTEHSILTAACTSTDGCPVPSSVPEPSLSGSQETLMAK